MPTIVTTGGKKITFKVGDIDVIADHNDTTGDPGTCVYGIIKAPVMTEEEIDALMQRLKINDKFAKFTRPNGWLVWICGEAVSSIRAPFQGEYARGTKTVIFAGSLTQAVKESPDDVTTAVNACGGKL